MNIFKIIDKFSFLKKKNLAHQPYNFEAFSGVPPYGSNVRGHSAVNLHFTVIQ